jgi:hypothetical protein
LHLVFPRAFIAVLTPGEPDVITFQSAINNGVSEIYDQAKGPSEVVSNILSQAKEANGGAPSVQ